MANVPIVPICIETIVDGKPAKFKQVGHHAPKAGEFFLGLDGIIQAAVVDFPHDPPCPACGHVTSYRRIILRPTEETLARIGILERGYKTGEIEWFKKAIKF